jgi:hypothetical protein
VKSKYTPNTHPTSTASPTPTPITNTRKVNVTDVESVPVTSAFGKILESNSHIQVDSDQGHSNDTNYPSGNFLVSLAKSHLPPSDIRSILSQPSNKNAANARLKTPPDATKNLSIGFHNLSTPTPIPQWSDYGILLRVLGLVLFFFLFLSSKQDGYHSTPAHKTTSSHGALVDHGANGGIAGSDVRIISTTGRTVDITGIDNHQLTKIKIGTVGSYADSQRGPVILIMHQYAIYQQNQTIHSSVQLEHFKSVVDDRSVKAGGMQRITTNEGYIFPLDIIGGLPYLKMRPYTDAEFNSLPHVILSSDVPWNVGILDCTLSDKQDWYDNTTNWSEGLLDSLFNLEGNYKILSDPIDANIHDLLDLNTRFIPDVDESDVSDNKDDDTSYIVHAHEVQVQGGAIKSVKRRHNYEALRPFFLNAPLETVEHTMDSTTQFGHNVLAGPNMYKTF